MVSKILEIFSGLLNVSPSSSQETHLIYGDIHLPKNDPDNPVLSTFWQKFHENEHVQDNDGGIKARLLCSIEETVAAIHGEGVYAVPVTEELIAHGLKAPMDCFPEAFNELMYQRLRIATHGLIHQRPNQENKTTLRQKLSTTLDPAVKDNIRRQHEYIGPEHGVSNHSGHKTLNTYIIGLIDYWTQLERDKHSAVQGSSKIQLDFDRTNNVTTQGVNEYITKRLVPLSNKDYNTWKSNVLMPTQKAHTTQKRGIAA